MTDKTQTWIWEEQFPDGKLVVVKTQTLPAGQRPSLDTSKLPDSIAKVEQEPEE